MNPVEQHMAADLAEPPPPGLEPLIETLRRRLGPALRAVVLYGSTRRRADVRNGLVDLMAVVDGYRAVHPGPLAAALNAAMPPNVYYLEAGARRSRLRCKYIVVSTRTLAARTRGGLDVYFWARFAQPCRCVWAVDDDARAMLAVRRAAAARTFATRAVGLVPDAVGADAFWTRAISASYRCELRPEPPGAATALVAEDPAFWDGLAIRLFPELGATRDASGRWRFPRRRLSGLRCRTGWFVRRFWNRVLHLLRLLKAAGTFTNGIDYLRWKIERHSGVRVEVTERMRRHPRLAAWRLMFRLWRRGALK
jgi:hypothetical protein